MSNRVAGYWFVMEVAFAAAIIGLAIGIGMSSSTMAVFKARLTEGFILLGRTRLIVAERIALTGAWDPADEVLEPVAAIDPALSLDAAEEALKRRGGIVDESSRGTRVVRLGGSAVLLFRYPEWGGTGALSFRAAVPDVAVPASVLLLCGPGGVPQGWVAASERVASNIPVSHLPWMCRGEQKAKR